MRAHSTNHRHFTVQVIKARRRRRRKQQQQQHILLLPKGCVLEQYKMPFLFRTKYGANCWHAKKKNTKIKRETTKMDVLYLFLFRLASFSLTHSFSCFAWMKDEKRMDTHAHCTNSVYKFFSERRREKREREKKNSRAKSAKPSFPNVGLRLGRCFCCWAERNLECAYILKKSPLDFVFLYSSLRSALLSHFFFYNTHIALKEQCVVHWAFSLGKWRYNVWIESRRMYNTI